VWSTFQRLPVINTQREQVIQGTLHHKARDLGCLLHAVGGIEDHVHVIISIPPSLAVAECVRQLKGASSHAVNHMDGARADFKWQAGYGAISISEGSLAVAVEYARNQRQHHEQQTAKSALERTAEEDVPVISQPT
jgi:REP element-mobilizing transposase RayT